ncbi:hypothetical protein [Janthinobacterium sp. ROICE36]|uniref:hypothetical protein n=1 Tax=Janthinobacterium sp. ROICE36 TaxID=2048670 RepID=UPI0021557384|nr:hypothetical protein [Janthinobacterium sp. ROICE36]
MPLEMKPISKLRFEALASYCRKPETLLHADELEWHQAYDETILIVVVKDYNDGDYSALLLTKDLMERYRWVGITAFYDSPAETLENAPAAIEKVMADFENAKRQGDEGEPVDFFTPVFPAVRLNPELTTLLTQRSFSPALEIIKPMMRWYEDPDGNYVEQFQTTGFNTRLWELYLFAMLAEVPFAIERKHSVPDFSAAGPLGKLFIEATSVNPSGAAHLAPPPMATDEQRTDFLRNYMPIRFAGPLVNKLTHKHQELRYWEHPHVRNNPLVFAIQDFHAPGSLAYSSDALPVYLYGMWWTKEQDAAGNVVGSPEAIETHVWGDKVIESGFFYLPDAEHISAVIINPNATISKFNRMGLMAGFGSPDVWITRRGFAENPRRDATEPMPDTYEVGSPDYVESWMEGLSVFHNPNANIPLDPDLLPGAAHHFLNGDGTLLASY